MLRGFAFARRDSSGSDGYGGDGREREKEGKGDHPGIASAFLIRVFPHDDILGCSRSSFGLAFHPSAGLVTPTKQTAHRDDAGN